MSKANYYAVARGRKTGIYKSWYGPDGAEIQVSGFKGAKYKGFSSITDAEVWLSTTSSQHSISPEADLSNSVQQPAGVEISTSPSSNIDEVTIYTDGGCIGNPGPGGYGVVLKSGTQRLEFSGGYRKTTNNRMELLACIVGLQALEVKSSVTLYSDSSYVVQGISNGWAKRWRKKGWMRNTKERAENPDLWTLLIDLCDKHSIKFEWVRGHAGNAENERCDDLATQSAKSSNLPADVIYEQNYAK